TNGEGQRFPKGLVVGYVADAPSVQRDATMRFVITPSLDFATLDEVLVVTSQLEELPPFAGDGARR
ncbi:MAG: rod shape-determining protein MreC, partial [Myxococcota bacterium]|nr:rod shape-determining protein MreC [Myxococcota bacterium]